jgi:hypothetical protein
MAGSNQWVASKAGEYGLSIENDEGVLVAGLNRTFDAGRVNASQPYRTTDEQWQSIVDGIAAAPEMLAACKEMVRAFERGDSGDELVALRLIKDAIAKAEPVRMEKRKVRVQVDVEVDVLKGVALDIHAVAKRVQDESFLGLHEEFGTGTTVRAKATSIGELYEDASHEMLSRGEG